MNGVEFGVYANKGKLSVVKVKQAQHLHVLDIVRCVDINGLTLNGERLQVTVEEVYGFQCKIKWYLIVNEKIKIKNKKIYIIYFDRKP